MKIAVVVPSKAYFDNAGARIRYGRLASPLNELGLTLELVDVAEFDPALSDHEAVIISKCHDAQAPLIARAMALRGRLVGVDLFDDYFSQRSDSRMVRFRRWLAELSPWLSFALCSTPAMADVARTYAKNLPVTQINDPAAPDWDKRLPDILERKLAEARDEQRIRIGWFGIGDNPFFPVGISDLSAFADRLAQLGRRSGFTVELRILTNARALKATRLAMMSTMPLRLSVAEWSEEAEAELLAQSFACFLPVNAQPFSVAKSLNRAVTALTAGCQVLSAGYPLYSPIEQLIYRDMEQFATDLGLANMKLSAERFGLLWGAVNQWASASNEAAHLAGALRSIKALQVAEDRPIALLHGNATSGAAHNFARKVGGMSVATPFAKAKLDYDVIFRATADFRLAMLVRSQQAGRLAANAKRRLGRELDFGGKRFAFLPADGEEASQFPLQDTELSLPAQLASYGSTLRHMKDRLSEAFGPMSFLLSENSPLPFDVDMETPA